MAGQPDTVGQLIAIKNNLRCLIDGADFSSDAQKTLLCSWLTQIYVTLLSIDAYSVPRGVFSVSEIETELAAFISERHCLLDRNITYMLLGGAGMHS